VEEVREIAHVGVVGCGLMGSGIAEVCARSGFTTTVCELSDAALTSGRARVAGSLARGVEKAKFDQVTHDQALGLLSFTTDLAELHGVDIVIEAIVEQVEPKLALFAQLDAICSPDTILATNTSSIPITRIATSVGRPNRIVGMHFFNPVPVLKLVEVIPAIQTDPGVVARVSTFASALGKVPIVAKDRSGFVVNALLVPYLLGAVRMLEAGHASASDIDTAMTLGASHPIGPLALADLIGLDTCKAVADSLFDEYADSSFAAPPLLKRMVEAGYLGRKSGRGFFTYPSDGGKR
jgi:3-hydroxybutyryl-CoA dehydrogenase